MSEDWLVRGATPVELAEVVAALGDVAPTLALRGDRSGQAIVVVHDDVPVVWIGRSRELPDPWAPWLGGPEGGPVGAGGPWWTEITGPTHHRVPLHPVPQLLVRDVARAIARTTVGAADRLSAASLPTPGTGATTGGAEAGTPAAPVGGAALPDPPADVVNDALALLVQSRPVVALTPWLVQNHVWAQAHDRRFVLLTPAATELTHAAWAYLHTTDANWVVDAGDAMYDGLSGHEVDWQDGRFSPLPRLHPGFTPAREDVWRVCVDAETTHSYEDAAVIGAFSRDLVAALGLQPPARQGLLEPPESAFEVAGLTTYARTLSPRPSRFVLQGPGWEAVCEAVPQPVGVVERLTLSAAAGSGPLPAEVVQRFLGVARTTAAESAVLGYRRGSDRGHVPCRLLGPTVPAALHLSRRRFPTLTDEEARRLGGPALQADGAAVQLTWAPGAAPTGAEPTETNPALHLLAVLDAVQQHDSHRRAARQT